MNVEPIFTDAGDADGYRLIFRKQEAPLYESFLRRIGENLVGLTSRGVRVIVSEDGSIISSHAFTQAAVRKFAMFGEDLMPSSEADISRQKSSVHGVEDVVLSRDQNWL